MLANMGGRQTRFAFAPFVGKSVLQSSMSLGRNCPQRLGRLVLCVPSPNVPTLVR